MRKLPPVRIGITGTGIVCALGGDKTQVLETLKEGRSGLAPLSRFPVPHGPTLPVGQTANAPSDSEIPLTMDLARKASDQAMASASGPPDAIVIGMTTGGMALTETRLKQNETSPDAYRYHGLGRTAEDLAARFQCKGPVLTISTACSSGGCSIAMAMAMIRSGQYKRVLTGGVDSLCRLTYYGFKSLQLIDPQGSRPLDAERRGMSVAEGAGFLLLEAVDEAFDGIEALGAGLSCDAHHPAQPHPRGDGALEAMQLALADAGLNAAHIDYVNLHGTGTADNDRSESMAVNRLFDNTPPPASSIKGATGHTLAAAGAIEAVIAAEAVDNGWIPANTGCLTPDPDLNITPVQNPTEQSIRTVLSNSFGFGGNNASVLIGRLPQGTQASPAPEAAARHPLSVTGWAAVSGAGRTDQTLERLSRGMASAGRIDTSDLCQGLAPGVIRRIKRLSHMGLALLADIQGTDGPAPDSVYFGTGWGSLSETNDFLKNLFDSDEKFSSPTDFIGSVHNAAAGQIALMARATGANLTFSGGEYAFEQALFSAQMMVRGDGPVMILGADETHDTLSPLFDPFAAAGDPRSDGGGALMLVRTPEPTGPTVTIPYFENDIGGAMNINAMVAQLGGAEQIRSTFGTILAGQPAAHQARCREQLDVFVRQTGFEGEVVDYRKLTGEFATAAAVASVFSVSRVAAGDTSKGILVLGLGPVVTAITVEPS